MKESTIDKISICAWNMRGFDIAIPYLRSLISDFQIVCVSEHWLFNNQLNRFDEVSDGVEYICHASKHSPSESYGCGRGQGGVGILWDKRLTGVTPLSDITHDRFCAISLQNAHGVTYNIFSVYLPAAGSADDLSSTLDELSAVLESRDPECQNIICGDCNGDIGDIVNGRGRNVDTMAGRQVQTFCERHQYWASNLSSTAVGPLFTYQGPTGQSVIDYILVPTLVRRSILGCGVIADHVLNTSDHNPVFIKCSFERIPRLSNDCKQKKTLRWGKISSDTINNVYTRGVDQLVGDLVDRYALINPCESDIDEGFCDLIRGLHACADKLPKTKFKRHLKPYWCEELGKLKFEKVETYHRWVEQGRSRDKLDPVRCEYIQAKKAFNRRLHRLAREYENEQMRRTMTSAEVNSTEFWKILKKNRGKTSNKIYSVENKDGVIVHDIDEVLDVWREHFGNLCTPSDNPEYDQNHFNQVNSKVEEWFKLEDKDEFLNTDFSIREINEAIVKLNIGKAPGSDRITSEHLKHGGEMLVDLLVILYNWVIKIEYIPRSFREGIQVPLHKGKNTPTTNPDNFRGINLISTFCKLFEILVWARIEEWWMSKINPLQGASRKGVSCLHSAMLLQETISDKLEKGGKVFITYFDVSKAFDSVWVNGLFFQLRNMGIVGTLWRILYRMYCDFKCRVRIGDKLSAWYNMRCGIHQGGYLSLVKYISFINTLIVDLEESNLCCVVSSIPTTPVGYADDLATASVAKCNVDMVMRTAHTHSCKWRYRFNARKSAVMVHGETPHESKKYSKLRQYCIRGDRVKELNSYDHVGVKSCLNGKFSERLRKLRKAEGLYSRCLELESGNVDLT